MENLEDDVEATINYLISKQEDFDKVMQISREIIRESAQAITYIHIGRDPSKLIKELDSKVAELKRIDKDFKYNTLQAYQEYSEAMILYGIKNGREIPTQKAVGVDNDAYLMGLMDAVGELKREIIDCLSAGKIKDAEFYFEKMRNIYDSTRSIRFAEAVLQGFRHKQDTARIQIENAGSEILSFKGRVAK